MAELSERAYIEAEQRGRAVDNPPCGDSCDDPLACASVRVLGVCRREQPRRKALPALDRHPGCNPDVCFGQPWPCKRCVFRERADDA